MAGDDRIVYQKAGLALSPHHPSGKLVYFTFYFLWSKGPYRLLYFPLKFGYAIAY